MVKYFLLFLNMKKDQLITSETAVLAKEKGFIFSKHADMYIVTKVGNRLSTDGPEWKEQYPTQTSLQTWFRDEHNIKIYCVPAVDSTYWYSKILYNDNTGSTSKHNSYEEALEHGLKEALIKL